MNGARPTGLALALLALLLAGVLAAVNVGRLPAARSADAPGDEFSAARALRVLERIASRPHPVGSTQHAHVRLLVGAELEQLGFEVEEQRGTERDHDLTNLLVRIPGTASTGTVLCCAHYDSVPTGPGAGDDGVGVVTWIETLRALRARGWQPRNDVLLLLTDGEELGLLGARLFARAHPDVERIATVVNLEAIGNGGPAVLFQLGPESGERVRAFARAVARPTGTSLADAVYRRMPNDTDLSVFLRRGIGGFNLALTCGSPAYHAPHDTPANLDPRSLQHMGDCALALVAQLGELDLADGLAGGERTFFDALGRTLVHYPRALDLGVALLGVALVAVALRRARVGAGELGRALLAHGGGTLAFAVSAALAWWVLDACAALVGPRLDWLAGNTTSGALAFGALVLLAAGHEVRAAAEPPPGRELAPLLPWTVVTVALALLVPGAGFACAWPLVAAGAAALALPPGARATPLRALALLATLAAALVIALPILALLAQLFMRSGALVWFVLALALSAVVALFRPQLRVVRAGAPWSGAALLAAGALCLVGSVVVARLLGWRTGALWP